MQISHNAEYASILEVSLIHIYMSVCVSSHHISISSYPFPESSWWFHKLRCSQANQLASCIYLPNNFSGEDLIAPCHCKGTQKYVHRSCLDNWRSTKVNSFSFLVSLFDQNNSIFWFKGCRTIYFLYKSSADLFYVLSIILWRCPDIVMILRYLLTFHLCSTRRASPFLTVQSAELSSYYVQMSHQIGGGWD